MDINTLKLHADKAVELFARNTAAQVAIHKVCEWGLKPAFTTDEDGTTVVKVMLPLVPDNGKKSSSKAKSKYAPEIPTELTDTIAYLGFTFILDEDGNTIVVNIESEVVHYVLARRCQVNKLQNSFMGNIPFAELDETEEFFIGGLDEDAHSFEPLSIVVQATDEGSIEESIANALAASDIATVALDDIINCGKILDSTWVGKAVFDIAKAAYDYTNDLDINGKWLKMTKPSKKKADKKKKV